MNNESPLEIFPAPSPEEWIKIASAEINGADPFESLKWGLNEHTEFKPFYSAEDSAKLSYLKDFVFTINSPSRPDARFWFNLPEVRVENERSANAIAIEHLKNEADGIIFNIPRPVNFPVLLNGIEWENCVVSFVSETSEYIEPLMRFIDDANYDIDKLQGAFFCKQLTNLPAGVNAQTAVKPFGVFIEESNPIDEVSQALTSGVELIDRLVKEEYDIQLIGKLIAFNLPSGNHLLADIAKFKALRMLWYQVIKAYGAPSYNFNDLYIHGRSEPWINPRFQPHGNMLKGTISALAMICGGCNSITVEPEDPANPVMNRIARNASIILKEESHFGKTNDPFAGAYGVEVLIDRIAQEAWKKFQVSVEKQKSVIFN